MFHPSSGCLTVVGVGYQAAGHVTPEALSSMMNADRLFFLVYEPVVEQWLGCLNSNSTSLALFAAEGRPLMDCCDRMVDEVLSELRRGRDVCMAFSGHPAVAVYPAHEALRRAKAEGHATTMLPAVSAMDCLFADLGVDPSIGCQFFQADALINGRFRLDRHSALIVFEVGVIGVRRYRAKLRVPHAGIVQLTKILRTVYPAHHKVTIYEAAMTPIGGPRIEDIALSSLPEAGLTPISTLYVPPIER